MLGKVKQYFGIEGIKIVSDRAKERQTPVAFTDVDKEEMELSGIA